MENSGIQSRQHRQNHRRILQKIRYLPVSYYFLPVIVLLLLFLTVSRFILPAIEKSFIQDRKDMIREILDVSWEYLRNQAALADEGVITDETARENVLDYYRNLRYGPESKDYFWIINQTPEMIMHPYRTELNSMDLNSYQDPRGVFLFRKMVEITRAQGEGYVSYLWQWKDDSDRMEEKISYVRLYKPWGWIIGTGLYVVDIRNVLERMRGITLLTTMVLLVLFSLLYLFLSLQLYRSRRKQMETQTALLRRDEFYKALFDSSGDAILLLDSRLQLKECNRNSLHTFGYDNREELLSRTILDLSPPRQPHGQDSRELAFSYLSRTREEGARGVVFDWIHQKKDGTPFPTEVTLTFVPGQGEVLHLAIIRDITERKHIQERLNHAEKMDSLGQLAGGIAHDFNNFLGGIIGTAELLQEELQEQPDLQNYVALIMNSADKATDLSMKLLSFARKSEAVKIPVSVNLIIRDVVSILQHTLDKRIRITADLDPRDPCLLGDMTQIQTALMNLALNARDAMPDGGEILLSSRQVYLDEAYCLRQSNTISPGEYVHITVRDTGTGIPPELREKIFDPFFTTKERGKGTGLGLASVYGTVVSHQGLIQVYTEMEMGTAFSLYFPLEGMEIHNLEEEEIQLNSLEGRKLLLVDDDELIRKSAEQILTRAGLLVTPAENGLEGLECFSRNARDFDFVLLDMIMPGMNGRELLVKIRQIREDIPVIIASGFTMDQSFQGLTELGASAFVQKPYHRMHLLKILAGLLKSQES